MDERDFFDRDGFGQWLKEMRKEAGYASADTFAKAVHTLTGLYMTKDIVYKLESGSQDMTVSQLMAFSFVLYSRYLDYSMVFNVQRYLSPNARRYQHAAAYIAACDEAASADEIIDKAKSRGCTDEADMRFALEWRDTAQTRMAAARSYLTESDESVSGLVENWHRFFDGNALVDLPRIYDGLSAAYDKEPEHEGLPDADDSAPTDFYDIEEKDI